LFSLEEGTELFGILLVLSHKLIEGLQTEDIRTI